MQEYNLKTKIATLDQPFSQMFALEFPSESFAYDGDTYWQSLAWLHEIAVRLQITQVVLLVFVSAGLF